MIKLLRKCGIPNVVAFRLTDPVLNTVALLYERIINERQLEVTALTQRNQRSNYFLSKQFKRLMKYARNGEYNKFNFLATKLLCSFSFQIQAYNSVVPKFLRLKVVNNFSHLRYLRKLCWMQSTDLDYKRVWIDKKPGDYARPLGVPQIVWRVYLRMLTNIGEIFLEGQGLYSNFQHGGRPGKGVMTCLEAMIKYFDKFDRVFEFDLKGFFDHVSKEKVRDFFKGTLLSSIYYRLLLSEPSAYKLPDPQEDKAVKVSERIMDRALEINSISLEDFLKAIEDEDKVVLDGPQEIVSWVNDPEKFLKDNNYGEDSLKIYGMVEEPEPSKSESLNDENIERYARAMEGENILFKDGALPSEEERNKGRDKWKDLNLPDQGIPQGTSFGPMLASTIAAYNLRSIKNLLLYVDDGMAFLKPGEPTPEMELNKALEPIMVELAPSKSCLREKDSLMDQGIKFLGTRFFSSGAKPMRSETRSGTSKEFTMLNVKNMKSMIDKLYQAKFLTKSKWELLKWMITYKNSRLSSLLTSQSLDIAMKWGFFGNLLSEAYNPEVNNTVMKRKISVGMQEAHNYLAHSKDSLGSFIINKDLWAYKNMYGEMTTCRPNLFNISTLACDLLLEIGVKGIMRKDGTIRRVRGSGRRPSKLVSKKP